MADIFQEAGLPLWLRPYEVLVTSSYTALIETIPDTASIHSIKSRYPNITSLRYFFVAKYQENSPAFKLAQVMESDVVPSQHQEEEEYVLLDLVSVYSQLQIPPNAPYVLSALDTMNPVLILDDKFKLIGQWDETIGTCLLFKEEVVSVVHEETGPSEANLFAGKCIVDQNQSPSKQIKPLGCTHGILKFRLAPDFDSPNTAAAHTQVEAL